MHAGEMNNGSDQRAHGDIFYAPSSETTMTAGIRYENARRRDEQRQRPAGTRWHILRPQRRNDHAGGQSSNICRGRTILFPTAPFHMVKKQGLSPPPGLNRRRAALCSMWDNYHGNSSKTAISYGASSSRPLQVAPVSKFFISRESSYAPGAFAYSIELYFDFSGYSLMALGLGRMLGFEFPKNFKHPYISRSVSEFWRRWHITLGRWFREYVYIPLGGNRKGKARTIFNLFVVWSLTAVWHGAEGHFLIWGASLLLLLALEKAFLLQFLKKSKILSHVYLVLVVPLTWMAFAIADVGQLGVYYARMFPFFGVGETVRQMDFLQYLKDYGPLFLMGIVFSTPYPTALYKVFEKKWLGSLAVIVVLGLSLYYMAVSTNNPFLYFNF